jgi:signal transduction histidine kinase
MDPETARPLERPPIARLVLALSLLFHTAALVLFVVEAVPTGQYSESPYVFELFLAVSAILACSAYFVRLKLHFRILLFVRAGLLLLFCSPFGRFLDIPLLLFMVLFVETGVFEAFPTNLVSSGLVLLASLAFAGIPNLLSGLPRIPELFDLARYLLAAALVALLASLLTFYRERLVEQGREMAKLGSVVEELTRAQMGFFEFARRTEERSTQSERNRMSAELHDSLGYTFTNLKMMLEAAKDLIEQDPSRLRDLLDTGLEQVQQGMQETRKTLYLLRDRREEKPPFLTAVHRLIDVFRKATGVAIMVDYANFPFDAGDEVEFALYHFVQEGLVNSFSHGKAGKISVIFWSDEEKLQVTIEDNGVGVDTIVEGIGIRGMRERLGKLGGTLSMGNMPGGFQIVARLPAKEELWKS